MVWLGFRSLVVEFARRLGDHGRPSSVEDLSTGNSIQACRNPVTCANNTPRPFIFMYILLYLEEARYKYELAGVHAVTRALIAQ